MAAAPGRWWPGAALFQAIAAPARPSAATRLRALLPRLLLLRLLLPGLLLLAGCAGKPGGMFARMARLSPPPTGALHVAQGSGVFIDPDGLMLTAAHVVQACMRIDVALADGQVFQAELLRRNPRADVALLAVRGRGFATLPLAVRPSFGARLLVLAWPAGRPGLAVQPATGLNRRTRIPPGPEMVLRAPLGAGASGGPILDQHDEVVGLVRGVVASRAEAQAWYGLPIDDLVTGPGLSALRDTLAGVRLHTALPAAPGRANPGLAVGRVLCWN